MATIQSTTKQPPKAPIQRQKHPSSRHFGEGRRCGPLSPHGATTFQHYNCVRSAGRRPSSPTTIRGFDPESSSPKSLDHPQISSRSGERLQGEGDQRLWFVVDELDALGAIDGLKDALARLRKFGGRTIIGFQSIAQVSGTCAGWNSLPYT
jgi:Type IV secretion-system coupling protein DNA-binding domain